MNGLIKNYASEITDIGLVSESELAQYLVQITNGMFRCYLKNTYMYSVTIKPDFINIPTIHTIFSRRDKGYVPYLLSDLSSDLINNSFSRLVIDTDTEESILNISSNLRSIDFNTKNIVIIEDKDGENYLILEGNKRTVGMHIAQNDKVSPISKVFIGKTELSWEDMLALHQMKPNA